MPGTERVFDEAYYKRFYEDPKTRVYSAAEHRALGDFVCSFMEWNQLPIDSVLDVGAGIGLWRDYLKTRYPKAKYTGTEVSSVMCAKHGFKQCDIARWRDRKKYDLIICQGVLQYLSDPDISPAVANIASMAKGIVYFEALTRADLRDRADLDRTDGDVHVRNGSYYRGLFAKHFIAVGGGLHWPRDLELPFWELDVAGSK